MRKETKENKNLIIRNATAEFLIFSYQTGGDGVEVRVQDGTIWLSQKNIAELFQTSSDNIGLHIKNIFLEDELDESATTEDFSVVQKEGNRNVGREHMGLTTWAASPSGKILKSDVTIAKNYLSETELQDLGLLVNAYLDLAERRAKQKAPMMMEDWAKHLDLILRADGNALLQNAGKISAEIAKKHAEGEYEKYRIVQDRLFQSDFDRQYILGEIVKF